MNAASTCERSDDALFACAEPASFDAATCAQDFPILSRPLHGRRLVYLDNAASAQKPRTVLDAMQRFYEQDYANIHRGVHELSARATTAFESARDRVRRFLNAGDGYDVVFTRGATEAINLVASSWGGATLREGDEILLTALEHHANIVPWQLLRARTGATLRVVPLTPDGDVRPEDFRAALSPRVRIAAFTHMSNAFGTLLPVERFVAWAHEAGALALVDGTQAVSHQSVDLRALGADFYVFSGHKLYGPTGIGALVGRKEILAAMPPWQGGGDMIESVTFAKTTFQPSPQRFEAGTPPIAEAVGLGAALDYLGALGMERIARHEATLLARATERLAAIPGLRLIGTAPRRAGVVSFVMEGIHPHDIGTVLDRHGVAIRAGHHCAQPALEALGLTATARASFGLYNNDADIEVLVEALQATRRMFA